MIHQPPIVLLAEDSLDDERLALRAMRQSGLPLVVRVARDGEAALRALGLDGKSEVGRHRPPDLIVTDLKMPMVNGDEVLRLARAEARFVQTPIVVFTSSDEAADRERCQRLGASEFLSKPVDYVAYVDCVRSLVHRWLADWRPECPFPSSVDPSHRGAAGSLL
jgi:CheY-like chemotaxis protein